MKKALRTIKTALLLCIIGLLHFVYAQLGYNLFKKKSYKKETLFPLIVYHAFWLQRLVKCSKTRVVLFPALRPFFIPHPLMDSKKHHEFCI